MDKDSGDGRGRVLGLVLSESPHLVLLLGGLSQPGPGPAMVSVEGGGAEAGPGGEWELGPEWEPDGKCDGGWEVEAGWGEEADPAGWVGLIAAEDRARFVGELCQAVYGAAQTGGLGEVAAVLSHWAGLVATQGQWPLAHPSGGPTLTVVPE